MNVISRGKSKHLLFTYLRDNRKQKRKHNKIAIRKNMKNVEFLLFVFFSIIIVPFVRKECVENVHSTAFIDRKQKLFKRLLLDACRTSHFNFATATSYN